MRSLLAGSSSWIATSAATWGRAGVAAVQQGTIETVQHVLDSNRVSGLGVLRRRRPVLRIGSSFAVVSRRADVLDVLEDHDTFATPYATRLPGPFVLGLVGSEYDRHRAALDGALRADDLPGLRVRASAVAARCLASTPTPASLDVGRDLIHPAYHEIVAGYLGIAGPDAATLLDWSRAIFEDIFLNEPDFSAVHAAGSGAAHDFRVYVDRVIARRRGEHPVDDVLGRLLEHPAGGPDGAGLDDAEIRDNLMGLAIGWFWHGTRAAIIAVDELLERPEALSLAQAAARADDLDELQAVLWEVLRFRPVQVGVNRVCQRSATVGAGTPHETRLEPGTTVVVGTHSAMWDDEAVPDPTVFDALRADQQYLIFGHGRHRCLGEGIMKAQLPALLAPLLASDGLRRSPGRAGRMRWTGGCPDGLGLTFTGDRG